MKYCCTNRDDMQISGNKKRTEKYHIISLDLLKSLSEKASLKVFNNIKKISKGNHIKAMCNND